MAEYISIAGNLYLWFFVSAFFFALSIKSILKYHVPLFYTALAFSIVVMSLSVFFVEWTTIRWNFWMIAFYLGFTAFWFVVIRFPSIPVFIILVMVAGSCIVLNSILTDWCRVDTTATVMHLRQLSQDDNNISLEITDYSGEFLFLKRKSTERVLSFYVLKVSNELFFVPGRLYLYPLDRGLPAGFKGFLNRFLTKIPFMDMSEFRFEIPEMLLLKEYLLGFDSRNEVWNFRLGN